ncbi:hypothetical protein H5399_05155 [Tessaracoccus sp. MC1627]|uniref:hypothetical protein n=1 Tax=Tessaracoccus sp. MC1627 TaxID=2760312 RepID=UPI001603BD18|nr:hypothetical protein [Tessaracoccus sp. MC1627]MBB1511992.1 hypothetical protein [Tessaracoccus sp. MC1627]
MSTYRYAVKVGRPRRVQSWGFWCEGCETQFGYWADRLAAALRARAHSAICEDLHRANWGAACPSCKAYGRVAKACPVCLGRGWCK